MTKRISSKILKINSYYELPKYLFDNKYKDLSNNSKILYSILNDHHKKNILDPLVDDEGNIYIEIPQCELLQLLNISSFTTLRKLINELIDVGLIEKENIGSQLLNRIYIINGGNL